MASQLGLVVGGTTRGKDTRSQMQTTRTLAYVVDRMWLWMVMPCVVVLLSTFHCLADAATRWLMSTSSIALRFFLPFRPSCRLRLGPGPAHEAATATANRAACSAPG